MRIQRNWQSRAKCAGGGRESDPVFFVGPGGKTTKARKLFCDQCPVKMSCLMSAVLYDEEGIWAGTTKKERDKVAPEVIKKIRDNAIKDGIYERKIDVDALIESQIGEKVFKLSQTTSLLQECRDFLNSPLLASL